MDVIWLLMILGSVLVNIVLFLVAIIVIAKHIKVRKFEFFFLFIMISIPLAFFINNFFLIYSYVYGDKNDSVILDFEKHDNDRIRTFLRWREWLTIIKIILSNGDLCYCCELLDQLIYSEQLHTTTW